MKDWGNPTQMLRVPETEEITFFDRLMSYEINRGEPSPQFLAARNLAGMTLQEQFKTWGGKLEPSEDYKWIKAELTSPSFDDLTFGYRNQVFSVLVDLVEEGRSLLPSAVIERCREAARDNHLIACVFPIDVATMQPVSTGWNLYALGSHEPIEPENVASDEKIPMSKWEMRNFSIQIVLNHLQKDGDGDQVLSFTDVLGIDPQIWFENQIGERNWIVVRNFAQVKGLEWKDYQGLEKSNPQLRDYDGYFAAVSLASAEAVLYDLEGNPIPLSERFTGGAPLFRGDSFYVKFDGLKRIYVS